MSKDSTPQFRIEIRFTSDLYAPCQKRQQSDFDSRRLDLFSLLRVKRSEPYEVLKESNLNNITAMAEHCVSVQQQAASPSNRINTNGLTLKILLLHDSLLFQVITVFCLKIANASAIVFQSKLYIVVVFKMTSRYESRHLDDLQTNKFYSSSKSSSKYRLSKL